MFSPAAGAKDAGARADLAFILAPDERENWLGREGSNLRMPESKSGALPLGDAPAGRPRINQPGRGANPTKWPEGRHFCPVAGGGGHGYKGASRGEGHSFRIWLRRVAQPGRALRSGRRGRRFESSLSDHSFLPLAVRTAPASATQTTGRGFPVWGAGSRPRGRSANDCSSPGRRRKNRKTCRRYRPTVRASGPR